MNNSFFLQKFYSLCFGLLISIAINKPAQANSIINGSFELPNGGAFCSNSTRVSGGSNFFDGWETILNGVEYCQNNPSFQARYGEIQAQDGKRLLDLAFFTTGGGGLQQNFSTIVGESYNVSFFGASLTAFGRNGTGELEVSVADKTEIFDVFNLKDSLGIEDWQLFTFDFVAISNTTTLSFQNNQDPLQHFAFLDNVQVKQSVKTVPEPANTVAFLAIVGTGFLTIRKQKKTSSQDKQDISKYKRTR
ncbi:MAG: DUF642 domain-containing protein [Cyanobacteria bacterium P01_E01_bin.42]